ncbi:Oxoglutarate/iron-dependent dioxygenase [uncultured Caudovirales phage]|uniref:Oxoglutarate/iron-dependent dioxygenase n=1 Tax=uncultured Caudovirales phage TaxID=2100421 RepID=A0A6J7WJM1_9CAUD|nr:Oxoglutarate/iron-dependent dioxygenase [uncultured Caudovirales phage]
MKIENKIAYPNIDHIEHFKLDENIWVIPDFFKQVEVKRAMAEIAMYEDADATHESPSMTPHYPVKEGYQLGKRINALFDNKYNVVTSGAYSHLNVGHEHKIHWDSMNGATHLQWGAVVYINDDYEGGEIYYPELDLVYKPKSGDVVLHPADYVYRHGVKEVKVKNRYFFAIFIYCKDGEYTVPEYSPNEAKTEINKIKLERGCSRCGYNKNPDSLVFYSSNLYLQTELEPIESDGKKYDQSKLMNDIDKTEILCLNCETEQKSGYTAD